MCRKTLQRKKVEVRMDNYRTKEISVLWCGSERAPKDFRAPVVYVTKSGKLGALKDTMSHPYGQEPVSNWKWVVEKYSIEWWTYQTSITNQI